MFYILKKVYIFATKKIILWQKRIVLKLMEQY